MKTLNLVIALTLVLGIGLAHAATIRPTDATIRDTNPSVTQRVHPLTVADNSATNDQNKSMAIGGGGNG